MTLIFGYTVIRYNYTTLLNFLPLLLGTMLEAAQSQQLPKIYLYIFGGGGWTQIFWR